MKRFDSLQVIVQLAMLAPWVMVTIGLMAERFFALFPISLFAFLPTGIAGAALAVFGHLVIATQNTISPVRPATVCLALVNVFVGVVGWMLLYVVVG